MTFDTQGLLPWWDAGANEVAFEEVDPGQRRFRYASLQWRCPQKQHRFSRPLRAMMEAPACPTCALSGESFATKHPRVARMWHPSQNDGVLPRDIPADFGDEVWWACGEGHAFRRSPRGMTKDDGCPKCELLAVSLEAVRPRLAALWHGERNAGTGPGDVRADSAMPAWWLCPKGHSFQRPVRSMVQGDGACPTCYGGWSVERIKAFVRSLLENLEALDPSEIFSLAMQAGAFKSGGAYRFALAISSGKLPKEELQKFVDGKDSQVEQMTHEGEFELEGGTHTEEALREADPYALPADHMAATGPRRAIGLEAEALSEASEALAEEGEGGGMPLVQTKDALKVLSQFAASADEETVRFLLDSALAKLWRHAFVNEGQAQQQAEEFGGKDAYSMRVREDFLRQLTAAQELPLPQGYAFRPVPGGPVARPLLMQRHVAVCLREKRHFGNWSGMGAGKTLSACLATRVVGAELTVICCPNSVVENWQKEVKNAFPGAQVQTKTWEPVWEEAGGPKYLVLNYEAFQQADSEAKMVGFLEDHTVGAMVIDEIHFAKQRAPSAMSRRKRLVQGMRLEAQKRNPELCVLGMSGTPVINELQEGKSLVELVTGVRHDDLLTKATVQNCMRLYQKLVTHGTRWQPDYAMGLDESQRPLVDCAEHLDEIRRIHAQKGSPLELERVLTQARIPAIVRACERGKKTLVYTHYVDGVVKPIRLALEAKGLVVGTYTGQTGEEDLWDFLDPGGRVEVLIASSRISTGVDGLQHVCSKLVINALPWTRAEYEQLRGRLWRQGSRFEKIEVVVPLTYIDLTGGRWSYCRSKLDRLDYKKSIADAAVDGQIPAGTLRTPAQAQRDILSWLERLDGGGLAEVFRPPLRVPLSDRPHEVAKRARRYGDFTQVNNRWYASSSQKTHERLTQNPEEWAHYHTLYQDLRKSWDVVPFEEEIAFWAEREGKVLGDFGCGEALIAKALGERHRVYSFDHVAIDDDVVACDIRSVPVLDGELHGAIFCLSLMGTNFTDYIREAHRCLKIDGELHIWEGSGRLKEPEAFVKGLKELGFETMKMQVKGGFIYIRAFKEPKAPLDVRLKFGGGSA